MQGKQKTYLENGKWKIELNWNGMFDSEKKKRLKKIQGKVEMESGKWGKIFRFSKWKME